MSNPAPRAPLAPATAPSSDAAPDVTLLFPPFCLSAVDAPHLALPTLSAHLDTQGIACRTFDLNVRFFHWIRREGGPYDQLARSRIERFRHLQTTEAPIDGGTALEGLLRDVACAPTRLLREVSPEHVIDPPTKDLYGARASLARVDDYQLALEIDLWDELVRSSIASSVAQAVSMQADVMSGPLGQFLGTEAIERLIDEACRSRVVGITISFSLQLSAALAVAHEIKRRAPSVLLALGGSQITLLADDDVAALARLPFVDAVARFEGEAVLTDLHHVAAGKLRLSEVPSLVYRDAEGEVRTNDPVKPIALNDLPVPRFNEEELPLYLTRALPVNVTRGCYWGKCTFCDYVKLMAPGQPRYVGRDPVKVVDDLVALRQRHGATQFNLITEALPPKWAAAFSKEVLARKIEARFWSYLKNEKKEIWSEELLSLMSAAGIKSVTCGVESTTDRVLEVIDKGTTREIIEQNFQAFANVGIRAGFNLIPDYPTTTLGEAADGLRFVLENRDIIPAINPQMFDLSIQSAVAGSPEQFGIELTHEAPATTTHGAHSLGYRRTAGMTDEERNLVREAYLDLRRELARHHLTAPSRRVTSAAGFRWEKCRFLMHPDCRAIRSSVAMDGSRREVVIVIRLEFGGGCLDLPARYARVVDLLTRRNRGMVTFADLEHAYARDVADDAGASIDDLDATHLAAVKDACIALVDAVASSATGTIYSGVDELWHTDAMTALLKRASPTPPRAPVPPSPERIEPRAGASSSPQAKRLPLLR